MPRSAERSGPSPATPVAKAASGGGSSALSLAVSLLSASSIAHQILLMRLLSIVQWHHFAFMVISLALLGYGASGTFLALAGQWLLARFRVAFAAGAALFGLSATATFAVAQRLPFNPLELAWNTRQLGTLGLVYLLLAVPFFCAGAAVGLALMRSAEQAHRIYRADLAGAGLGAAAVIVALFALPAERCLLLLLAAGLTAGALTWWSAPRRGRAAAALALAALVVPPLWPASWLRGEISQFKGLPMALAVPGAEVVVERSSPLGLLTVVRSSRVPLRYAPGLSLNYPREPVPQLGVFTDGDALSVIDRNQVGDGEGLGYLDFLPSALPYHLLRRPRVLVLGAGGGSEVLSALTHGATRVDAVDLDPQVVALVRDDFADFAGHLYQRPEVSLHVAEARGFLSASEERWDLIQISLIDSLAGSAAGVHALAESYLYTVEAFSTFVDHLRPGGLLALTRWLRLPPRDSLKLLATAAVALERRGLDPGARVALLRGWNTVTLLAATEPLGGGRLDALRRFAAERSFDLAYYPGMAESEANRYNLLPEPYLFRGAVALLGPGREQLFRRYKFFIRPATDDRPYFFHFLKWRSLPEIWAARRQGTAPMVEWGYLVLVAALAQATIAGAALILLPLALRRRHAGGRGLGRSNLYFFNLGLAFMLLEMAYIQRFILYLAHPLYAVAVVLAAFLLFAGVGSGLSRRVARRLEQRRPGGPGAITLATTGIAALALLYLALLPPLFARTIGLADGWKVLISLALIAPLALLMGMPFPLGLARLDGARSHWVPWAWGFNGWASVLAAVAATLIAIHLGLRFVVLLAVLLYLAAGRGAPPRARP